MLPVNNLKKLLLFLFLFSFSMIANGQIQLGVKGGYFFNNVTGYDPSQTATYSFSPDSYLISVFVRQCTQKKFNLGLEGEYTTRSYNVITDELSPGSSFYSHFHVKMDQLNILIKPQFVFGQKVKYFFYPGMFIDFMSNIKDHGVTYGSLVSGKQDTAISNPKTYNTFPFIFGLMAGFGIEIPLPKGFNIIFENNYSFYIGGSPPDGAYNNRFIDIKLEAGVAYTFKKVTK